jgi:hypothetical protein
MRLPRFLHRFWAWLNGYFWAPCPVCGRMFGGHEAFWRGLRISKGSWRSICGSPDCLYVAEIRNRVVEKREGWPRIFELDPKNPRHRTVVDSLSEEKP